MTARITELAFDVSDAVALPGSHTVSMWLFPPDRLADRFALLVCLPGGTYTRAYYHLEVDGLDEYSFAGYMAARGHAVAVIDPLGVGASSRPLDGNTLTAAVAARAHASALEQLLRGLGTGSSTLGGQVPDIVVGVGHSLGGQLTISQQAAFDSFGAVAILGWSNQQLDRHGASTDVVDEHSVDSGYLTIDRSGRLRLFHDDDVPQVVIDAEQTMTAPVSLPLFQTTLTPGVVAQEAEAISVPVFLAFGARDVSPDPYAEVGHYRASRDITLLLLDHSAHCHNFASSRGRLFGRLSAWCSQLLVEQE
jgi:pimeloyl-ACP methyl ester carboxylesterase